MCFSGTVQTSREQFESHFAHKLPSLVDGRIVALLPVAYLYYNLYNQIFIVYFIEDKRWPG